MDGPVSNIAASRVQTGGVNGLARTWAAFARALALASESLARERRQWVLWLPVGLGGGSLAYFALDSAAQWRALGGLAFALALLAAALTPPGWRRLGWLPFAVALGLALAVWRAESVAAPRLARTIPGAMVTGIVSAAEAQTEGALRLVVAEPVIAGLEPDATPTLLRLSVRKLSLPAGEPVRIGDRISVRAWLQPPPSPAAPGGYDFARKAWFQGIGGIGRAIGPLAIETKTRQTGLRQALEASRLALGRLIRARIEGDAGAVAAAFVNGERGAISDAVDDDMRDSGLAHLLSISGLHIALVAGAAFWLVRKGLALWPWAALHWPLKSIGALAGLVAAIFYTLISGASWPTVRSSLAIGMVLVGVLVGRSALTLRLVAVAAAIILLARPEAAVDVSCQLSFAAVTALVSLYQSDFARRHLNAQDGDGWLRTLARHVLALVCSGLAVDLMLAPIALGHFNRWGLYGVAANIVAIPLTSFAIMPALIGALLLEPLGLAQPFWWAARLALDLLLHLAHAVGHWPGAVARLPSLPAEALASLIFGGLWLCLWQTRLRLWSLAFIATGILLAWNPSSPVGFIDGEGKLVGVVQRDGRLGLSAARAGGFSRKLWLEDLGIVEARWLGEPETRDCAAAACWLAVPAGAGSPARSGWTILHVRRFFDRADLAPLCRRADIVVAPRRLPHWCRPRLRMLDQPALRGAGGLALWVAPDPLRLILQPAAAPTDHPWRRRVEAKPSPRSEGIRASGGSTPAGPPRAPAYRAADAGARPA